MHACAFVDSRDEAYALLLPYLKEGLECNAHLITMVGKTNLPDHLDRLRKGGMEPSLLAARGRLSVSTAEDTFRRDGSASPASILRHWEARIDYAHRAGFELVRGFGEMDSALAALRRTDELLELEARVNFLANKLLNPIVCVYDINTLSGNMLLEILSTHPKVIRGGALHENGYFVSPQEYLRELAERKNKRWRVGERRRRVSR